MYRQAFDDEGVLGQLLSKDLRTSYPLESLCSQYMVRRAVRVPISSAERLGESSLEAATALRATVAEFIDNEQEFLNGSGHHPYM